MPEALWFCLLTELPEAGCEAAWQTQALLTTNWKLIPSSHWVPSRDHASADNAGPVSSMQVCVLDAAFQTGLGNPAVSSQRHLAAI